jgi:DMSO reductase anchor subunit
MTTTTITTNDHANIKEVLFFRDALARLFCAAICGLAGPRAAATR